MRYFSIGSTYNLEVIGHYPQTDFRDGYNPTLSDSHWQVKKNEFPDFVPNFELELHDTAIPTDLIDGIGGYHGLLISSKFKDVLQKYVLPSHHFYPIKVYHKNKLLNYFWFHYLVQDIWNGINLKESEIRIQHSSNKDNMVILPLIDKSYVKYLNDYFLNKHEFNLLPEKIVLNKNFKSLDVIDIDFLYSYPLISNELRKTLLEEGLTGFELKLYKKLVLNN